ncbi:MAG: aminotransferase class I/II-fold pyridoxal phosphate-dependent enzyme [Lachnospiraceae bacterium]|nr:aminotransferase class I/II-fold pyridoxal phosphate-dependent enzyme [Lachnospiraceae bacterium]
MLDEKLKWYGESDFYPFHMPGHKRAVMDFPNPYQIDITEIEGFDNLHHSEGILQKAQMRAAKLYGSQKTYYLVNGSTCGILASVFAGTNRGDKILVARNSHKSVYHALYLHGLTGIYVYPAVTGQGIQGGIAPEDVEEKLREDLDIRAVVVTSPTYEGIVSDIASITEIVHKHGIPLIVDEAHGAHFGFSEKFPKSAVAFGADAVIQSLHKQLPSFTQTALLHLNSQFLEEKKVQQYLGIFETSSPSYILMAGMEKCIRFIEGEKANLFLNFYGNLEDFYQRAMKLHYIKVLGEKDFTNRECFAKDPSKLVISVKNANITGRELYRILLEKYHLQMEMEAGFYVLAMTSVMDKKEGFLRLLSALEEIDKTLTEEKNGISERIRQIYKPKEKKMELWEAMEKGTETVSFHEAPGRISGSMISVYPPGIPVLLPGELVTEDFIKNMRECKKLGLNVQGIADIFNERIDVIDI